MKIKNRLKILVAAALFIGVAGAGYYFLSSLQLKQSTEENNLADGLFGWKFPIVKFPITGSGQLAYSDIRDPGGIPDGLPVRLKIPVIGVDAAIEDALITPDGRMDVPVGSRNVAWFALGPHPGKEGSAVIGGHFGIRSGIPFVFYDLDKLKVGDKIYVIDDKGNNLAFVVRKIKLFDRNADATEVFTSSDGKAHLNLITCEGVWNKINGNYPQRRVVFTDAVPAEGEIVPTAEDTSTFFRSLSIGAKGTDVSALQTILEQKGFLIMPRGVAKGYFGALTRVAVAKYQASVGLSATGVFNMLTRVKITAKALAIKPDLPQTSIIVPTAALPSAPQNVVITSVNNLFATPIDGAITAGLLISIVFTAFKISRQYI